LSFDYSNTILTQYENFAEIVDTIGFMPFSKNSINFLNLSEDLTKPEQWHTDLTSDPWPWRVKIETDHRAAYAKLFDKKPGFISLEWYPIFLAARRKRRVFEDFYHDGLLSNYAKQIYLLFEKYDVLATHEIKGLCNFTKETNSKYEAAMLELQMYMLLTTNGMKQKISAEGDTYGWPATAYSTVEFWAGKELIDESDQINPKTAADEILSRIFDVVPDADQKKVLRFAGI
jgi:hypothetical protein